MISKGTEVSESWNACALPWKVAISVGGAFNSACALWIASVAWLSDAPGARLKLIVVAGNWLWWLIESGWIGVVVHLAIVESGTSPPWLDFRKILSSELRSSCSE